MKLVPQMVEWRRLAKQGVNQTSRDAYAVFYSIVSKRRKRALDTCVTKKT